VFRGEGDLWTHVDFKTDPRLDVAAGRPHHAQVALYRLALEESTGVRAEAGSCIFQPP
jgi:hypothetical protein